MRKKTLNLKTLSPYPPPFFPGSTSLPFLYFLPPPAEQRRGTGMEVAVSSSHLVSAAPSSSRGELITLFPCSTVKSLSWETILHKLLQHESFPWAAALHELLQGFSPSGTGCSSVGPPRGHKPRQKTCAGMGSSFHGSTGPGRSLFQCRLPLESQPPLGTHLLWRGVPSTGYRWRSAPLWTSIDCRGTTCLTMVFITSCKGKLSALASGAPPPPPSSLTLVSAEFFLSLRLTPFS